MCGIAGIINKNKKEVHRNEIKEMCDAIKHRGPDAEGQWISGNIGLGHRRLSILDLSAAGEQPMISSDGTLVIVFNGEIYNYVELRNYLMMRGSQFNSDTDTEVILEAYKRWGTRCVTKFNGMWAFVIYDLKRNQLFCSRDRFGVKPFYYLNRDDVFAFGSEPKAILRAFPEERIIDETTIYRFLTTSLGDMDNRSFYKNIKQVEPATNLIIHMTDYTIYTTKYWEIDADRFAKKWLEKGSPVFELKCLMEDAVKIRLRSDVPVGTSLSGGLDSSSIVGIINKKNKRQIDTFSSVYDDKDCNEKEYIDEVNKFNNARDHLVFPDSDTERLEAYKRITWHHDGPTGSASLFSGYSVYSEAQKYVKVLLDGQGADEIFGGYLPYNERIRDLIEENTLCGLLEAAKTIGIFYEEYGNEGERSISSDLLRIVFGRNDLFPNLKVNHYESPLDIFSEEFLSRVDKNLSLTPKGKVKGHLNQLLFKQIVSTSLPDILHNVDSNSMTFSLEVRCPFLDYRVVEFAMALEGKYKVRYQWTKWILRKAMKQYLPEKIIRRTNKMGFPAPFGRWLRDERGNSKEVRKILERLSEREFIKTGTPNKYYDEHICGKRDHSWLIYQLMTLELWMEMSIDSNSHMENGCLNDE